MSWSQSADSKGGMESIARFAALACIVGYLTQDAYITVGVLFWAVGIKSGLLAHSCARYAQSQPADSSGRRFHYQLARSSALLALGCGVLGFISWFRVGAQLF